MKAFMVTLVAIVSVLFTQPAQAEQFTYDNGSEESVAYVTSRIVGGGW
ncbi:hypothetical protein P4V86_15505 [Brevibacillus laterosporus]|uniref:Uncharacterized protein n=1 Tax=Brevibacillus laterosporus TaxID=1465 RepID=A0AAP3DKD1_BRELA|nr:hypothetical protein [Brevibacillus laterosporus]MCR8981461.1 hypothetical protein [Brevibacillus laterosporus]MCZ0808615.1 hypothetical protein [Brevibacillus laterosporus]MCZ0827078.1 hypothetical protein [Brevibacillus laterosporus]MCZ0850786.1 hypothetical protein [Brevibacillus laterosporus]MED2004752.1 hypothetical protein [Brevibacillus laterosporus]